MKEETIFLKKGQYLSEVLPDGLPTNVIIAKGKTGCGATQLACTMKMHTIIVEYNLAVIESKVTDPALQSDPRIRIMAVKAGVKVENIMEFISNCRRHKIWEKILVTPECFPKVMEALRHLSIRWNHPDDPYFLVIDEMHKTVTDIGYRPLTIQPMEEFFKFNNKAMMSTTAIIPRDPRFEEQGFKLLRIEPEEPELINADITVTNAPMQETVSYINAVRKEVEDPGPDYPDAMYYTPSYATFFIFLNSPELALEIMRMDEDINQNAAIFCSEEARKRIPDIGSVYSEFKSERMERFNFLTERFYTGNDIKLDIQPYVISVTFCQEKKWTMIDPATDAIQIPGRFRNGIAGYQIITDLDARIEPTTAEKVEGEIEAYRNSYEAVKVLRQAATTQEAQYAYQTVLDNMKYRELTTNVIPYAEYYERDRYCNDRLVESGYSSSDNLAAAYQATGKFNFCMYKHPFPLSDIDRKKLRSTSCSWTEMAKKVVETLTNLNPQIDSDYWTLLNFRKEYPLITEVYETMGAEIFERCHWNKKRLENTLIIHKSRKEMHGDEMLRLIYGNFREGEVISHKQIKETLNRMARALRINQNFTAQSIKDYFETEMAWPKNPETGERCKAYRLVRKKVQIPQR